MKDKSLELNQVEEVIVTQQGFNRKYQNVDVSHTIKVFSHICPQCVPYCYFLPPPLYLLSYTEAMIALDSSAWSLKSKTIRCNQSIIK